MYLKSLELSGFKSFAKKATLSFTSPVVGIVGPNGSGKSNVAEAFRFVLGEQSIKSLRGKRGEDLIWNGADQGGRANRAHVKLTFDNSRRLFAGIDFDEVSIERVVNRDNSNEYLLNGTAVRLKDIVELLGSAHIGATGHHIISQGEADRILSANIRERREMVEDALGLKVFQWKKSESLKKLERTEENMKQVESLRREVAPHLRFLKKQVEKVERAEELRRELTELYRHYFATEKNYLSREKARLTAELQAPEAEMRALEQALAAAKQTLAASQKRDHQSDAVVAIESELSNCRNEKDSVGRELGRLEGEISANRRTIDKEREKQKRDEFKTVYLKDVEEAVTALAPLSTLTNPRELFERIITELKAFITKHRGVTETSLIGEAEKEISLLMTEKNKQEEHWHKIAQKETELVKRYDELQKAIEKEKDTDREAEKEVFRIIARENEVRSQLTGLRNALETILQATQAWERELAEAAQICGREAVAYEALESALDHSAGLDRAAEADTRKRLERLKIRLEEAGAGGGAEVLKEYRETEERDAFLARELEDLTKAKAELQQLIGELENRIDSEFKQGIQKINEQFGKFFVLMFGGGKAELSVVREVRRRRKSDEEELSETLSGEVGSDGEMTLAEEEVEADGPEGLEVNVSLPRKKVKGLMMLSGGERALTSIALLFAISQVNPPPFIILDETDAALDEANSRKYADMIESLSERSQLILITHNRETMSRAGVLYGVTMGADGASKLLSIAFEEAVKVAK